jgi:hypothetical protein
MGAKIVWVHAGVSSEGTKVSKACCLQGQFHPDHFARPSDSALCGGCLCRRSRSQPYPSAGIIFGELLGTSVVAAIVAETVGRLVRIRRTWFLVVAVFLLVWFAVRFAIVVNHMVTGHLGALVAHLKG